MTDYVTKDSGERAEYGDGMRRDTAGGKPKFALMFPEGVPYEEQLITRVAALYARGGEKYGDHNWEKSGTEESLAHHKEALMRHVVKFLLDVEDGEDHGAAVVWNVNAVDLTRRNIARKPPVNGRNTSDSDLCWACGNQFLPEQLCEKCQGRRQWREEAQEPPVNGRNTSAGQAHLTYVFTTLGDDGRYREYKIQAASHAEAKAQFDSIEKPELRPLNTYAFPWPVKDRPGLYRGYKIQARTYAEAKAKFDSMRVEDH